MPITAPITVEDVLCVARNANGDRLPTIGDRALFIVELRSGRSGEYPVFTPESTGEERKATNQKRLAEVVAIYNRTASLRIPDYKETGSQNLSYILRLVNIAADTKVD